jgi:hypothetical protein
MCASAATADVVVHTTFAAFDAVTNTAIAVTFDEPIWSPAIGVAYSGTIATGGVTFVPISSSPTFLPNLFIAPATQTNFCCPLTSQTLTSSGGENIDLVFAAPTQAVGLTCYANLGAPIIWTLTLEGGSTVVVANPQPASTVGFVGFTSHIPIVKLNWTSDLGHIVNTGIDDVRLGTFTCPADLNQDGTVDAADLAILLGGWGSAGPGDLDASGDVSGSDLAILLGAWGPCP